MDFNESFIQAFTALKSNKLRSVLTMLGMVMGIFSIIAIVTLSNAAKAYLNSKFELLGANIVEVKQKSKTVNESDWLKLEDIDIIKNAIPTVKDITVFSRSIGVVRAGSRTRDAVIMGTTSSYKNFRPFEIIDGGRFLVDNDVKTRNNVVVVDESFAMKYYNTTNITGKTLQLKDDNDTIINPRIIGVLKSEGDEFENFFGEDFPVIIFMPATTVQMFSGSKKLEEVLVSVTGSDKLQETGVNTIRLLEFTHGNKDKYIAANSADIQKTVSDIMGVIQWVLLLIAIITLAVGGIGIINILLVSVTERIREIGVKKALGARKKDIITQFLTESMIMTGISGIIGIFLGVAAGNIASAIIKIPQMINVRIILAAFICSVILGAIFGVYPAKRAADLDPIQSLRYE